ncbi:MAG: DUF2796 domain-containing protein [Alphaproteobacteria bacterium]|nr:DUF2796 domain-containing protein [Alphaproteobacteria bacterium]
MTLALPFYVLMSATLVQHGAHVHGQADLAIAMNADGSIEMELRSNAYNYLASGSEADEHDDHGHDDHDHHGHDDHAHDDHDDHGHDDHGHDDHDDHASEDDPWIAVEAHMSGVGNVFDFGSANCELTLVSFEQVETPDGHMDVIASYAGRCAAPARMGMIETTMFDTYPALENIVGVYIGPEAQSAFSLTRETIRTQLTR